MFKDESVLDSSLKTNWEQNCTEQPSLHTKELFFSGTCWCFSLKWSLTVSTLVMAAALERSDSSLLIVTDSDHFILSITEIATRGEYTEPSVAKTSTLDFTLLVFVTFHYNPREWEPHFWSQAILNQWRQTIDYTKILSLKKYAQPKKTHLFWTHKQA